MSRKKDDDNIALHNCEQAARNYASMSEDKGISESLRMARLAVSVAYRDAADEIRFHSKKPRKELGE